MSASPSSSCIFYERKYDELVGPFCHFDMTKPFGKPIKRGLGLTRTMRLTIALWGASIPAFLLCKLGTDRYPTLSSSPFFWPGAFVLWLFSAVAIALWLRRRPSPRGPWESSRTKLFIGRLLLALLLAAVPALGAAFLYEPALGLANGMLSPGAATVEHAMLTGPVGDLALHSFYWEPGFRWKIPHTRFLPSHPTRQALAAVTLRRGMLGARWVERVDYTEFR